MGIGPIFLKISAPHCSMMTYRMNLISARSISLDSTFKCITNIRHFLFVTGNIVPQVQYTDHVPQNRIVFQIINTWTFIKGLGLNYAMWCTFIYKLKTSKILMLVTFSDTYHIFAGVTK
jgi:hypothetical protein